MATRPTELYGKAHKETRKVGERPERRHERIAAGRLAVLVMRLPFPGFLVSLEASLVDIIGAREVSEDADERRNSDARAVS